MFIETNNIDHFREKNLFYAKNNIYVIWVFDIDRFKNKDIGFKEEYRINEILKEAHTMYRGHVYGLDKDNDEIYAIHFDTATRINQDSGSLYYLKRTKYLNIQKIKDNTTIYRYIRSRNKSFLPYIYNTALISSNKWWKKENEIFETVNQFKKINNIC